MSYEMKYSAAETIGVIFVLSFESWHRKEGMMYSVNTLGVFGSVKTVVETRCIVFACILV